jgi:hypothetical protein
MSVLASHKDLTNPMGGVSLITMLPCFGLMQMQYAPQKIKS